MAVVILTVIIVIAIGGYFVWKKYYPIKPAASLVSKISSNDFEKERDNRDNQRINDISSLSQILENYFKDNGQYPVAITSEKISDESVKSFQSLKANNFLSNPLQDPLPDKYYYGYKADGKNYELTAVLENQKDLRCILKENLCIYSVYRSAANISNQPEKQFYINKTERIEFYAPKNWRKNETRVKRTFVVFTNEPVDTDNGGSFNASINIASESANGLDLNGEIIKIKKDSNFTGSKIIKESRVKINGEDAYLLEATIMYYKTIKLRALSLYMVKNNKVYAVTGLAIDSAWNKYADLFNGSLFTLKIL